ncbi:methionine--tRNA ligase subunit beta [candidate division WOR-1 bacterium RIFCSPHIGHO2_01_FULL_53_15]|uniref:Methionine--tRNA ligase n=1 Tax=candidate division WOR-1 bacterium RIFCSPHIGHO2_01_FULL_53_15 TaxID=1802564 RepID=A0A1F4Q301_UNCSA|nr:MAG: methionine--tRNA ligase subunit beta [candidate division WOR-1 bacterium RIFCSPHIGHO2_01_FULL_53_15]OGC10379.1 MAG: methionine--tRNA ligase subunit beta [candidate division WOR-1 bacterium RIFCSPHIGHO2_02_FULL_53_26]
MENITFDEFKKLDLRVGEIKTAEEIPGADKLYRLSVDLGGETRELVAGIKSFYEQGALIGRKIVVLVNLEPRTIRGVTSHGMLLAASNEDKSDLAVLTVEKALPNGAKVS